MCVWQNRRKDAADGIVGDRLCKEYQLQPLVGKRQLVKHTNIKVFIIYSKEYNVLG